ncbi:Uncharacterised protein [Achromobacter denitrificans]|uniref:Phasin family protein n=1 Tax=Achromobacter denitrificans TaxID=32002 RepID=A0A6J5AWY3_ACHDE|nr:MULTISPECIES: hypothetical protein [Achromobacter]OLU00971.1 hypothetical protein BVK87_28585 [Achromobacter denitrificans]QCS65381.1 hypothetical protein EC609_24740 [Achromobacter denitrificans]QKH41777.1 hypothetical protein FOC82_09980 [Achromobacter denitrificans]QKH51079.1 hypothetical protein FOC80_17170 [Achromobacter denitrificans]QKQ46958.1 hypothetical protein FOC81_09745 [Achromobacter denitrificans]
MKQTTAIPKSPPADPGSLLGANLAYCQRLTSLAQESQARWAQLGQQIWGEQATLWQSAFAPLPETPSWKSLAPALGEAARRQWQARLTTAEAVMHAALSEQATLAVGLAEAANTWCRDSACACNGLTTHPAANAWTAAAEQMAATARSLQARGDRHGS